jgi:hypothetical protein
MITQINTQPRTAETVRSEIKSSEDLLATYRHDPDFLESDYEDYSFDLDCLRSELEELEGTRGVLQ